MNDPSRERNLALPLLLAVVSDAKEEAFAATIHPHVRTIVIEYWQEFCIASMILWGRIDHDLSPWREITDQRLEGVRADMPKKSRASGGEQIWVPEDPDQYFTLSRTMLMHQPEGELNCLEEDVPRNLDRDLCYYLAKGEFIGAARACTTALLSRCREEFSIVEDAIPYLDKQVSLIKNPSVQWECRILKYCLERCT